MLLKFSLLMSFIVQVISALTYECPGNDPRNEYLKLHGNKCYYFQLHEKLVFKEARRRCFKMGEGTGDLAMPKDEETNEFLYLNLIALSGGSSKSSSAWIGLQDKATEGHFIWMDGSSMNYNNFDEGMGTNRLITLLGILSDCVAISLDNGKWEDEVCKTKLPVCWGWFCDNKKPFICQFQANILNSITSRPIITTSTTTHPITTTSTTSPPTTTSTSTTTHPTTTTPTTSTPTTITSTTTHPTTTSITSTPTKITTSTTTPPTIATSTTTPPTTATSTTHPTTTTTSTTTHPTTTESTTTPPTTTTSTSTANITTSSTNTPPPTTESTTSVSATQPNTMVSTTTSSSTNATNATTAAYKTTKLPTDKTTADSAPSSNNSTTTEKVNCRVPSCENDCGMLGFQKDSHGCVICKCNKK